MKNKICICQITGEPCILGEEICYYLDCELYHFHMALKMKQKKEDKQ
jgi:hypothetical protein